MRELMASEGRGMQELHFVEGQGFSFWLTLNCYRSLSPYKQSSLARAAGCYSLTLHHAMQDYGRHVNDKHITCDIWAHILLERQHIQIRRAVQNLNCGSERKEDGLFSQAISRQDSMDTQARTVFGQAFGPALPHYVSTLSHVMARCYIMTSLSAPVG